MTGHGVDAAMPHLKCSDACVRVLLSNNEGACMSLVNDLVVLG